MNGVLGSNMCDLTLTDVPDIVEPVPTEGLEVYGQDPEGPLPFGTDTNTAISSPSCPMNGSDESTFVNTFDPLALCDDYGIELYIAARAFVHAHSAFLCPNNTYTGKDRLPGLVQGPFVQLNTTILIVPFLRDHPQKWSVGR